MTTTLFLILAISILVPQAGHNLIQDPGFDQCYLSNDYWHTLGRWDQIWCLPFGTPVPPSSGEGMASNGGDNNAVDALYQPIDLTGLGGDMIACFDWWIQTTEPGTEQRDTCSVQLRTADMLYLHATLWRGYNVDALDGWSRTCVKVQDVHGLGLVNFSLEAVTDAANPTTCNWDNTVFMAWPSYEVMVPLVVNQ